ncbi:lmo0937 family membrane protein [Croceiramulus getboli]|nr:lmo0937 family membrane protein [Flavobacteriaceae bacterium YJPT1-3]
MSNLITIIIAICIIGWLLGYFAFSLGGFIHLLLVLAVIGILYRLATGRKL